jgi:hypothetical protein
LFRAQGTEHVVYRGYRQSRTRTAEDASGWHHGDLTAMTGAPAAAGDPAGYVFEAQGTQHVMYRSATVTSTSCGGMPRAGWHRSDLTAVTGAPAAAGDPAGYSFEAQGTQHVMYRSATVTSTSCGGTPPTAGQRRPDRGDRSAGRGRGPAAYVFDAQARST